jgi:hypothetical protein
MYKYRTLYGFNEFLFYFIMTRIPDYADNLSLRMSQVVGGNAIGVNEKMVIKRRRLWLLNE